MISTCGLIGLGHLDERGAARTTADGADDDVDVREVFEDLQSHGAETVQDLGFVALLDVVVARGVDEFVAVRLGVVEVLTVDDELGTEALHDAVDLGIVAFGDHHRAGHVEPAAGAGHGQPMIAARGHEHAALQFLAGHVLEEVDGAPDLERTGGVVVLVLDEDLAAHQAGEFRIVGQVRPVQVTVDDLPGLDHTEQVDLTAERLVVPHSSPLRSSVAEDAVDPESTAAPAAPVSRAASSHSSAKPAQRESAPGEPHPIYEWRRGARVGEKRSLPYPACFAPACARPSATPLEREALR